MRWILLAILVSVFAPEAAIAERRVALVIGNTKYAAVASLPNATRDADLIAGSLRKAGIHEVTVVKDADRATMATALQDFADEADAADWAIIYYAGHGMEVAGTNYMIPVDAKLARDRDVALEAISLQQMLQSVEGAKAMRMVILDACRDNPFAATIRTQGGTRSIGRGLSRVEPDRATAVIYAAKEGTTAADGDGANSPFASAFAAEVVKPGLEINLMFRRVRQEVVTRTGRKQEPFMYGSLPPTEFYFLPPDLSGAQPPARANASPAANEPKFLAGLVIGESKEKAEEFLGAYLALKPDLLDRRTVITRPFFQNFIAKYASASSREDAEAFCKSLEKADILCFDIVPNEVP